jgi:hypothetical protein
VEEENLKKRFAEMERDLVISKKGVNEERKTIG